MAGLFKIGITIIMLLLVFQLTELAELKQTLVEVPVWLVAVVILGYAGTLSINSFKWWLIAKGAGIDARFTTALRASFVGAFANLLGLGTVSGDVLKGLLLSAGRGRKAQGIASVFTDRLLGLVVLLLIGLTANLFIYHQHLHNIVLVALALTAVALIVGWFVGPWVVLRYFPKQSRFYLKVNDLMLVFPRSPATLLPIVAASLAVHLSQISLQWFIGCQLSANVTYPRMLTAVPFVNILSTMPISWNGIGIRENANVVFFCPDVFSAEQVITFGAIWFLGIFGAALIGGVVAVITGDFRTLIGKKEIDQEEWQ